MAACAAAAATCLCPVPFHHFLRPANAELASGGPFPCSFDGTRYRRGPPMVRNMRAVRKTASWGTRRIFRGTRCKKQASTVRMRYSVPKTASSGTRRIFKGPQNSTCYIERIFKPRRTADSIDCGQPTAAPDASSVRETAHARRRAALDLLKRKMVFSDLCFN